MAGFVTHRFYGFRGFVGVYFRFCGFFPSFVVSWFHRFRGYRHFESRKTTTRMPPHHRGIIPLGKSCAFYNTD